MSQLATIDSNTQQIADKDQELCHLHQSYETLKISVKDMSNSWNFDYQKICSILKDRKEEEKSAFSQFELRSKEITSALDELRESRAVEIDTSEQISAKFTQEISSLKSDIDSMKISDESARQQLDATLNELKHMKGLIRKQASASITGS